jgi:hypothetical protein
MIIFVAVSSSITVLFGLGDSGSVSPWMESDVIFIFFRIFTPLAALAALVRITDAVDDDVAAFAVV